MRKCFACAEEIQDAARVCKHCGRNTDGSVTPVTAPQILVTRPQTSPVTWGCTVLAMFLGLFVLLTIFPAFCH